MLDNGSLLPGWLQLHVYHRNLTVPGVQTELIEQATFSNIGWHHKWGTFGERLDSKHCPINIIPPPLLSSSRRYLFSRSRRCFILSRRALRRQKTFQTALH